MDSVPYKFVQADASDASALARLGQQIFTEAFKDLYKPEDLATFLAKNHSENTYRKFFDDPVVRIWVIYKANEMVGYCKIGPNSLPCDPPRPNALELSRIYFFKAHQGQGLGSRMIDIVFDHARAEGFKEIVLSVFSENYGGHRIYGRHGFEKIGEYDFQVGNHYDREWIMLKTL